MVDTNALAAWEQHINQEACRVKIASGRRFKIVFRFISMRETFRSDSRFVKVAQTVCQAGFLGCYSGGICATYAGIICAYSYQAVFESHRGCWRYSIALDVVHAQNMSYLDLRVQLCSK